MKANGELSDFSLSPSSSRDWGSSPWQERVQIKTWSSVQCRFLFAFFILLASADCLPPLTPSHLGCYKKCKSVGF